MTTTPNTAEIYAAHIPALHTLINLGWEYLPPAKCLELRGGNKAVVLKGILVEELKKRRFEYKGQSYPLSTNAIDQIVRDLSAPAMQEGLLTANERLYHALTLGITVTEFVEGKKYSPTVQIIDWETPENNSFLITEELEVLTTDGTRTRRPDLVGYVNGLPLVVVEAKRPDSGNPNKSMVDEGISQNIRNQKTDEIPHLFAYSQLLLSISGTEGRYATTKTPKKFWAKWHEEELTESNFKTLKNTPLPLEQSDGILLDRAPSIQKHFKSLWSGDQFVTDQDRLLISLLSKDRLLEFIRFFILYDRKVGKIVARYQQVFAIKALTQRISTKRPDGGREGGVIWHTTGSGKSFTMVFLCKALLLHKTLSECRVIAVTDRIDLEKQLARTFLTGGAFGSKGAGKKDEENRFKAATGRDLAKRIAKGNERIIFSIIHKFSTAAKLSECYNPSENIIVLIDEGHRSQSGENHERMKNALPNASYVAFTGTPLLKDDKTTNKFGSIVHAYTMQRAVEDGTVTPLLYEERKPVLDINDKAIDNWFEKITVGLSDKQKSDLKDKYSKKGQVYGSANRIDLIAWDIAIHFSKNFKELGKDLKGQLATDSKLSAVRYKKELDATGLVSSAIVISPPDTREGHEDVDESELPEVLEWWKNNVTGDPEEYERQIIEDFSEPGKPDILIVVDKLLTGFDEPKNAVLYIDKLRSLFSSVKNHSDFEQYRQILIPKFESGESETPTDVRQKVREDFYEALTEFGMCLKIALGSRSFYEDTAISEKQISTYKKDLKFFTDLRKIAKQDAQETIDFSAYEKQIRQLVDKYVVGEEVKDSEGVYLVNDLGLKEPSEWSEEKLRNETDLIKSRLKKTIEQELADDPYAQIYFSELLKLAIAEAAALFEHPFKQYALFDELEQKAQKREISDIPQELSGNKHACAYFGILRLIVGEKPVVEEQGIYIAMSLKIDSIVNESVAENSLNPQSIETAIRKGLLPVLFKAVGLENAKKVTEDVIAITRVGLSRGEFNG